MSVDGKFGRGSPWGAVILAAIIAVAGTLGPARAQQHPLDPLTAAELAVVGSVLTASGQFSLATNFAWIMLDEPPKAEVAASTPGAEFPRRASVAAIDYGRQKTYAVIVDIRARRIVSLTDLQGLQPGLTDRDLAMASSIVDADLGVRQALVRRGIGIPGKVSEAVQLVTMAIGYDPAFEGNRARLVRVLFNSDSNAVNDFSPFIDTLMAVVDLYSKRVIKLYDNDGVASVKVPHDIFDPAVHGADVEAKPVVATQPEGRNFSIVGNVVTWQNWQFRFGFNAREGLVLYQVGFNDGGRLRPVMYRASLAGLVTLYGDPGEQWSWMEYDDEANFGLGHLASAVRAGREVPATAVTLGAVLPDASRPGFSSEAADRIYVYERDGGNLMYYEQPNRRIEARATDLVVGFLVSLGNYTYGVNWVFKQDGSFAFEAELAGQVLTKLVAAEACEICKLLVGGPGASNATRTYEAQGDDRYGTLVYPKLAAINHQHWFNLRLDFDIDGTGNAALERNVKRAQGDGHFFTTMYTVYGKASDAKRHADGHGSRTWMIYNPRSLNRYGRPAGYAVMPMDNSETIVPRSRERGPQGFTFNHFWVTRQRDGQLYANGAYPSQAPKNYSDALSEYANNDPIFDQDIVVWYSMGGTHVPRPEDFPLMTNMKMLVLFRPDGFFERNPVLGLGRIEQQ